MVLIGMVRVIVVSIMVLIGMVRVLMECGFLMKGVKR